MPAETNRVRRALLAAIVVTLVTGATFAGPAPATAATGGTVKVRLGDTLTSIALRTHTSVTALAQANAITNPNFVEAGAVLRLPVGPRASVAVANASGAPYTVAVRRGDTLYSIARRAHVSVQALAQANAITNPNLVEAGWVLRLPAPSWALSSYAMRASDASSATASGSFANPGALPAGLRSHPDRLALAPDFVSSANTYGVAPSLLEALCWWESGWQANVVSSTGAVGVCQLEPSTTAFIRTVLLHGQALNPRVPSQNIAMGAALLGYLLRRTAGDQGSALAAYYEGLAAVRAHVSTPDTKNYVAGISAYARVFAAAG
jgi:LysM repeat protein